MSSAPFLVTLTILTSILSPEFSRADLGFPQEDGQVFGFRGHASGLEWVRCQDFDLSDDRGQCTVQKSKVMPVAFYEAAYLNWITSASPSSTLPLSAEEFAALKRSLNQGLDIGSSMKKISELREAALKKVDYYNSNFPASNPPGKEQAKKEFQEVESQRQALILASTAIEKAKQSLAKALADAQNRSTGWILASQNSTGLGIDFLRSMVAGFENGNFEALTPRSAKSPAEWYSAVRDSVPSGPNALGMKFVPIRAGGFLMGSPAGEKGRIAASESQHFVRISKPFEMQATEVTQEQWLKVMGQISVLSSVSQAICPESYQKNGGYEICGDFPVDSVAWNDVQAFISKLNSDPSLNDGWLYRLPTEAEWEYAARAGAQTAYSFGNRADLLPEYGYFDKNSGSRIQKTGHLKPNAWGLYDMHGNVLEWVQDWYSDNYAATSGENKVLRGGSNADGAEYVRSGQRFSGNPGTKYRNSGFRLVRTRR